jgi:hypothetical protein
MHMIDFLLHTFPTTDDSSYDFHTRIKPTADDSPDDSTGPVSFFFLLVFLGSNRADSGGILHIVLPSIVSLLSRSMSVCSCLPQLGVWSLFGGNSQVYARRLLLVFISKYQNRTIQLSFTLSSCGSLQECNGGVERDVRDLSRSDLQLRR